ncbi:MAG: carbohydrate ABC transporter permease [Chloroflexota bacterium]
MIRALQLPRHVVAIAITLLFVFPFYWMVVIALNDEQHVFNFPPDFIPRWHFENFATVWAAAPWARYFFNTVLVAVTTTLAVLVTSTLAGYAFASMAFPGKRVVFAGILLVYMVPTEVTLVPNFITLKNLGWIDTYQAQIVPFAASVFGIFLMRQFFLGLPRDLWEAAQLDGCGHFRYLLTIATPLARAPLVTVALFHFVAAWNSFLWPLIVANSDAVRPIQVGLNRFQTAESTDPVHLAAGSLLCALPILLLFLVAQRQIVGGIASSGIRG